MDAEPRFDPILLCALFFAMIFPTIMSFLEFFIFPGLSLAVPWLLPIVFPLGKFIQFAFPVWYMRKRNPTEVGWPRACRDGLGWSVGFAGVTILAMFGLYFGFLQETAVFVATGKKIHDWLDHLTLKGPAGFLVMALFIAVVHSALEEYYWRWFVFGRLRQRLAFPAAMVISGLAFMAHHVVVLSYYLPGYFWNAVVPFSLCVAVGGMVWAALYEWCRSLWGPWISHALIDLGIMGVGYHLLSRYW